MRDAIAGRQLLIRILLILNDSQTELFEIGLAGSTAGVLPHFLEDGE